MFHSTVHITKAQLINQSINCSFDCQHNKDLVNQSINPLRESMVEMHTRAFHLRFFLLCDNSKSKIISGPLLSVELFCDFFGYVLMDSFVE